MKMVGMNRDREATPLMKDLHELGLKYRVQLVVVAIPMEGEAGGVRPLLIDHKDETPLKDVHDKFLGAGVFLIKCAGAAEDLITEERP